MNCEDTKSNQQANPFKIASWRIVLFQAPQNYVQNPGKNHLNEVVFTKSLMLPATLSTTSFSPSLPQFASADRRRLSAPSKKFKHTLPVVRNFCYPKFSYRNDVLLTTFPDSLWKGGEKKRQHKLPPTENNGSLTCHFQEETKFSVYHRNQSAWDRNRLELEYQFSPRHMWWEELHSRDPKNLKTL